MKCQNNFDRMNENSVQDFLLQELELFKSLLAETKNFIRSSEDIKGISILELLETRNAWIEELEHLESQRRRVSQQNVEHNLISHEISMIAHSLIEIDARILDLLKSRKEKIIKEMINITDNNIQYRRRRSLRVEKPKIIDVRQE